MLTGQNGFLTQAQNASEETEKGKEKEQISPAYNGAVLKKTEEGGENGAITVTFTDSRRQYTIDENGNITEAGTTPEEPTGSTLGTVTGTEISNTTVQDSLGNKVVVPAGFKVQNPNDNVEVGIYIVDQSHTNTAGSEFVWIPVGTVHRKDKEDITITLGRYSFDSTTGELSAYSGSYTEDTVAEHTYDNTPAKDMEGFKTSVTNNGGYYIGRYEARTGTPRSNKNNALTQITEKPDDYIYNYVTQIQAAKRCQGRYTDTNFTSDLMNSCAWDTAIDFYKNVMIEKDQIINHIQDKQQ